MIRNAQDYLLLFVKGLAMGAADVVPGVSGGTIAFITGIYSELLHSLRNLAPNSLLIIYREGFAAYWRYINGYFLLAVFGGVLLSIKTFASVIIYCMEHYPLQLWGFFSGLIAASLVSLARHQTGWNFRDWCLCALGVVFVVLLASAKPTTLPGEWWILFLGGFIAICAMILPGISGSFILLLLGLYPVFLEAVINLDLLALASFGGGCLAGLLAFSRFLSWLLDNYFKPTIAVLIGFLVGSLKVTWPWKYTVESVVNSHGEVVPLAQSTVMPWSYSEVVGQSPEIVSVFLFTFIGTFLVILTETIASYIVKSASSKSQKIPESAS